MPFKSEKQRAFLYAKKPAVAKKFTEHSKDGVMKEIQKRLKKK